MSELNRVALAGSVESLAPYVTDFVPQLVAGEPSRDSVLAGHLASDLNVPSYGDFPIVRETIVAAMYATLSGVDHALSWAELVLGGRSTVALATAARGALEGYAKAFYLLSAHDTRELLSRHLAVTKSDLRFPLQFSRFQDHTGRLIDNASLQDVHQSISSRLALAIPQKPTVQQMVQSLLTAGMKPGLSAGPEIYSQLSGPAHGAMSALGMYAAEGGGRFELPFTIALEQAGYLFVGMTATVESWITGFGLSAVERATWKSKRATSEGLLIKLLAESP